MQIDSHVPLSTLTTMRIGGTARFVTTVTSRQELKEAIDWANHHNTPILMVGEGSNVIARDNGFDGLIVRNRISGFDVLTKDDTSVTIKIGAGEVWDDVVKRTVSMGLSGIEALSAIPGTAGATPVQNVGAYGQEISQTLTELEAYDTTKKDFVTLSNADCQFSYRNSRFKPMTGRRFVITSITLRLHTQPLTPPFYASLQKYLDTHNITSYPPQVIRDAVIAIRSSTLPNPKDLPNTGSFFKNPIISQQEFGPLHAAHPTIAHWPLHDGRVKLSAGWLIENAGLKGYENHGMKVYEHNALVFINKSATSYADLAAFQKEVVQKVHSAFGITLEQEPELL